MGNYSRISGLATGAMMSAMAFAIPAQAEDVVWKMHSVYAGTLPVNGTGAIEFTDRVNEITDGSVLIRHFEPGALLPATDYYDAVSEGAIEMAWGSPSFYASQNSAYMLFAAVPFGPDAMEYIAWMRNGGGGELQTEMLAEDNIVSIPCTIVSPETAGWYKEELTSIDDFKDMKIRFLGFGGRVLEELGASPQTLAPGDIYTALETGTIDATEFAMPVQDENLGFYEIAKHYYFPAWHQQSTILDVLIHKPYYDGLTDAQKASLQSACDAQIVKSIADGESLNAPAMQRMADDHGVTLHELEPEFIDRFREAWDVVRNEEIESNPDFARVWESMSSFRDQYAEWRERAYVD